MSVHNLSPCLFEIGGGGGGKKGKQGSKLS